MLLCRGDHKWKNGGVQKELKVQLVTSKCEVGHHWKEPRTGNKEGTPMRDGPSSCFCKARTMKQYVEEGPNFTITSREPTKTSRVRAVPVTHKLVCPTLAATTASQTWKNFLAA